MSQDLHSPSAQPPLPPFDKASATKKVRLAEDAWNSRAPEKVATAYVDEDLDLILTRRGVMSRIFRFLFRLITRSWQMYLVGFLFGLGFDTATITFISIVIALVIGGIEALESLKGKTTTRLIIDAGIKFDLSATRFAFQGF